MIDNSYQTPTQPINQAIYLTLQKNVQCQNFKILRTNLEFGGRVRERKKANITKGELQRFVYLSCLVEIVVEFRIYLLVIFGRLE